MHMMRLMGVCLLLVWINIAQAEEIQDTRFQVALNFEDAGVAPSIPDQVQQALPQLWQRIVPQSSVAALQDLKGMSLLKSVHPHGLSSTIIFQEQRVWQALKSRHIAHIRSVPNYDIQLDVFDTQGRHSTLIEAELNAYIDQISQRWGIQRSQSGTLLALHVQWLNDIQFYMSVSQQGFDIQHAQNDSAQGINTMQALQTSIFNALLHARNQALVQETVKQAPTFEEKPLETLSFDLEIEGQTSLSHQILLESSLKSDLRVVSLTPTHIDGGRQQYQVVVKEAPELWLESWFFQRGMTATLSLEGWLAQ